MKPFIAAAAAFFASTLASTAVTAETNPSVPAGYVPCKIVRQESAVFPTRLLENGVTRGDVTIVIEIDGTGKVTDQLVTKYSHEDFAREVSRVVGRWEFKPGSINGEPVISVVTVNFEFTVNGIVVYEKRFSGEDERDIMRGLYAYFAHGAETLDHKPVTVASEQPPYPAEWIKEGRRGSVTLRFYIDETGRTRIPIALGDADSHLSAAAVLAVRNWRFQPPLAKGKPVLAHAEQVFVFEPKVGMRE